MNFLRTIFPWLFPAKPEVQVNGIGKVHKAIKELESSSTSLRRALDRAEHGPDPAAAIRRAQQHHREGFRP